MSVDLSPIDKSLLESLTNMHGMPTGAFNIRKDGKLLDRSSNAFIDIESFTEKAGIKITIKPGTKGETIYIPVIVTKSGLTDVVYNDFYIGEDSDVVIIAGCGIHNDGAHASQHDGIHTFHLGANSHMHYIERHYAEGTGSGRRILNPTTKVFMDPYSRCEMEMIQIGGVDHTVRQTYCELGAESKMVLNEKLLTEKDQKAESTMEVELKGENSSVQVISRSVAKDKSIQIFNPLITGRNACQGHVQCDAIIMDEARVKSIPGIEAACEDAQLVHEAAIGKIAGDQITKLMTLGLEKEEAEKMILDDFLN